MYSFDYSRTLDTFTIGELLEVLDEHFEGKRPSDAATENTGRRVYGLKGIQDLFGVSHKTAQRLKDHDIKGAVVQNGRMIVVDVDKAMKLFNKKRKK